jgi:hypothetical protein
MIPAINEQNVLLLLQKSATIGANNCSCRCARWSSSRVQADIMLAHEKKYAYSDKIY